MYHTTEQDPHRQNVGLHLDGQPGALETPSTHCSQVLLLCLVYHKLPVEALQRTTCLRKATTCLSSPPQVDKAPAGLKTDCMGASPRLCLTLASVTNHVMVASLYTHLWKGALLFPTVCWEGKLHRGW